jgi:exodeoxyribonuclease VII small subunit
LRAPSRNPESYKKALAELDGILAELEADDVDVDGLGAKIAKAASLLAFCRARLDATELQVKKIVAALEDEDAE